MTGSWTVAEFREDGFIPVVFRVAHSCELVQDAIEFVGEAGCTLRPEFLGYNGFFAAMSREEAEYFARLLRATDRPMVAIRLADAMASHEAYHAAMRQRSGDRVVNAVELN